MGKLKNELIEAMEAIQSHDEYGKLEASFVKSLAGRMPACCEVIGGTLFISYSQQLINDGGF